MVTAISKQALLPLVLVWFGLWLLSGCGPMTFVVGQSGDFEKLEKTVVESDGEWFSDQVAIVDISGLIVNGNEPGFFKEGENPVSLLTEKLEKARKDGMVKAVILRVNSPGGTVTASDAMYREVLRFKEKSGKPVVGLMMDVAASGGYYVSCAADRIVAYPTTVTGSIGVILQTLSVKPALSMIGVKTEALTSGPNKDAGSPLSVLTDEQRDVLQRIVDDFYERFVEVVRNARQGIPPERFAEVTDGRVMSGEAALKVGLVDKVGDLRDAFAVAKEMAGLKRADLVMYHRAVRGAGSVYAGMPGGLPGVGTQVNLAQINLGQSVQSGYSGVYYLWDSSIR